MIKLFGMIHLPPLTIDGPSLEELVSYAVEEASVLEDAGFPALFIENFNDVPFAKSRVSDGVFAKFSAILHELRKATRIEIGVNLLRNACVQALELATVHQCEYIRCNVWESAYVTDQGIIESAAYDVITRKKELRSDVRVLADVMVKHATPLGSQTIAEAAENVKHRGGADGIIISGRSTGKKPAIQDVNELNSLGIKPILGSGYSIDNVSEFKDKISGAIVGTSIKENRRTRNRIDPSLARDLIENHL